MGLGRGGEWFLTPQGGDKKKTARGGQNKIGRWRRPKICVFLLVYTQKKLATHSPTFEELFANVCSILKDACSKGQKRARKRLNQKFSTSFNGKYALSQWLGNYFKLLTSSNFSLPDPRSGWGPAPPSGRQPRRGGRPPRPGGSAPGSAAQGGAHRCVLYCRGGLGSGPNSQKMFSHSRSSTGGFWYAYRL